MQSKATERLREFLAQLPPQSQAMLMREFERAVEAGRDTVVAAFVLEQLRSLVRQEGALDKARGDEAVRLAFAVLQPFLVDGSTAGAGQIRRASVTLIWQWLTRDGIPAVAEEFHKVIQGNSGADIESKTAALHAAAAQAIASATTNPENARTFSRIGPPSVLEDLVQTGIVFRASEQLADFGDRLLRVMRVFGESEVTGTIEALKEAAITDPQLVPFALVLIKQRLGSPWQLIRLAIKAAGSDDESRVTASLYAPAVSIVIQDIAQVASVLRSDIKRARYDDFNVHLKAVHDGIRGLRTELDIRSDSSWGRRLAAIRVEVSSALQSEIESVPGRVRRLLRQRPDKEITATAKVDRFDVDETAALIDLVAVCRTYAGELAINEVTLRTFSELQQYVERSTEALVASLRTPDPKVRAFRKQQVDAAVRFCEVLFGFDYASLMSRAAENAIVGDRKAVSRAG